MWDSCFAEQLRQRICYSATQKYSNISQQYMGTLKHFMDILSRAPEEILF